GATPFDLTIFQPDGGAHANDEPDGAVDLEPAVVQSVAAAGAPTEAVVDTLGGATAAAGEPASGGQPAAPSLLFSWTVPPGGGQLTAAVQPALGGAGTFRVAAWTGTSIATLVPVSGGAGSAVVSGPVGQQFLFSVDGPEAYVRLTVAASGVAAEDTT